MPRILILHATVGMGHLRAATALARAFEQHTHATVRVEDTLEHARELFSRIYAGLYLGIADRVPSFWSSFYDRTDRPPTRFDIVANVRALSTAAGVHRLPALLDTTRPDAIIATHFLPLEVLGPLRQQGLVPPLYCIVTDYRVTPKRIGNYPVVCAELCGLVHADMRQTARALSRADFDAKMRELRQGGAGNKAAGQAGQGSTSGGDTGETAEAANGKAIFTSQNCGSCHTLADAGTTGTTGPSLDDTLEGRSAEDIRKAIVDPNAEVADGFGPNIMPSNYGDTIPKDQLDTLVDYLEEQSR